MRKRSITNYICSACGTECSCRTDTYFKGKLCRSCTVRKNKTGSPVPHIIRCKNCNKKIVIPKSANKSYCSKECRINYLTIERECLYCHKKFRIYKSSLKTNATGNFCSRICYNNYLRKINLKIYTDNKVHYKRKFTESKKILKQKNICFCAICGTFKGIQYHHIIPYRITQNDNLTNIIPLCKKHHKVIEDITIKLLLIQNIDVAELFLQNVLRQRQIETYYVIKELNTLNPA